MRFQSEHGTYFRRRSNAFETVRRIFALSQLPGKETMRTELKIFVIAMLALATFSLTTHKTSADPKQAIATSHECVILQGQQGFTRYPNGGYAYTDIGIYCSSSSPGAPRYDAPIYNANDGTQPVAYSMAKAIAELLNQGYHIENIGAQGCVLVK